MTDEELQAIQKAIDGRIKQLPSAEIPLAWVEYVQWLQTRLADVLFDYRKYRKATYIESSGDYYRRQAGLTPFTYGERWQGDQVRYEVHDRYGIAWINGLPIPTIDWQKHWDQLFLTEAEAQAEVKILTARYRLAEGGMPDGLA